jgi:hypothetical protein
MLESILGSMSRERVLMFIFAREEGYPREIARFFSTDLAPIQRQLIRLEINGVLSSRLTGRTRLYRLNPCYPFKPEIESLLAKALDFYPQEVRERLFLNRRRPRRSGKPL